MGEDVSNTVLSNLPLDLWIRENKIQENRGGIQENRGGFGFIWIQIRGVRICKSLVPIHPYCNMTL